VSKWLNSHTISHQVIPQLEIVEPSERIAYHLYLLMIEDCPTMSALCEWCEDIGIPERYGRLLYQFELQQH
ncbi:hypothetical protein, partial [Halomarina rubra]